MNPCAGATGCRRMPRSLTVLQQSHKNEARSPEADENHISIFSRVQDSRGRVHFVQTQKMIIGFMHSFASVIQNHGLQWPIQLDGISSAAVIIASTRQCWCWAVHLIN
jgi:hypothetical protein